MTEPLDLRNQYTGGDYVYLMGGNGTQTNAAGKKLIDCSHMVNLLLTGAGYQIEYEETRAMNASSRFYTVVPPAEVKKGDIALWIDILPLTGGSRRLFHTGIVMEYNAETGAGKIFGAQTTNGPSEAFFGRNPPAYYWPVPTKFLRAKEEYRTGATPAPAPAPAAAPPPAGPAPLMTFQYPFRKADGKQFADAEEIYKALEAETAGHYLLGSNKFWHGGIHISNASAPQCVLNEPIRCMADGEVVAYRLNEDYLKSTFGAGETAKKLDYSSSFCLVRHEYKSVPNPEEGPNKGKQNKLCFYSLYMHLLPYKHYPLAENEKPKPIVTMTVKDFKAYDEFPASNNFPSPGKLAKNTKLEVLEKRVVENVTYAKGKILSGSVKHGSATVREAGQEVWFAYLKNGEPYQNSSHKAIWVADAIPERARPNYWQGKVKAKTTQRLAMYGTPVNPEDGKPAGARIESNREITVGSTIEFESKNIVSLVVDNKLRSMAPCTPVEASIWTGDGSVPENFWAVIESDPESQYVQWESITPSEFEVVTTNVRIKAGDPIGYLGAIENLVDETGETDSKFQVHVEIFTAEAEVKDFLDNIAGLKTGKQYLYLPIDTKLKNKLPGTGTSEPLKNEHAIELNKVSIVKEGGEDWYEVKLVDEEQAVTGLVKKTGAEIISQHDWKKLGFQIVEENNAMADGFLDPDDMPEFFKQLFIKIDKNHDGEVDPGELTEALKNASTREKWTKLIAHHPTEWKHTSDNVKWSKLDKILEERPKTLDHEKERISKYVFWDELGAAAISSELIWHFHPIGFINNFLSRTCIPLEKAQEIALLITSAYEGSTATSLDYQAVAGNFDGAGVSFGIIQWNFGSGTLGPLLLAMRSKNQIKFDNCFDGNMNFQVMLNAITTGNIQSQLDWADAVAASNPNWKSSFKKIGEVEEFKAIQLEFAAHYNQKINSCLDLMRELAPHLMKTVQLRTYCALFDLCVQQEGLVKAEQLIRTEFPSAQISTQKDLLIFVCRKRAEKAIVNWRSDAFSRRMGIIQGQMYTATIDGITKHRSNVNFGLVIEGDVCEL
ncbi:EF-hand domain-containing protein [Pseudomonas sp. TWP3-2]|uniref:EF-hand domain-containing protein n=1 Tax=Pseudomonas sp. TWP3-2 TaxID=2804574 RepID=UPI003CE7AEF1